MSPIEAEEAEVLAYFPDTAARAYQIAQWVPPLEQLAQERPVAVVLRTASAYNRLLTETTLPLAYLPRYEDLMAFYDRGDHKLVIYVNHGKLNFQSLTLRTALHMHVNHGESDKRSSFSNQAKAYDRVAVAGELAARRYLDNVLEFESRRLVHIGRPPLDFVPDAVLPPARIPTVLYAPTWEGESQDNNWSSVPTLGERIVEQIVGLGDVRLVYKPHPRVVRSDDLAVASAHAHILRRLDAAAPAAGHMALLDQDVVATFHGVDALITDVSAVGLDYLFVRPDSPIFLTDARSDRKAVTAATPLAEGVDVVDHTNISVLGALVASRLKDDAIRPQRMATRATYFGDLAPGGASTRTFIREIGALCELRDKLVAQSPSM